ncbi:MAG: hypothetical protein KDB10_02575 [Acidimicrobiales bacterium]|nr:hypothetical protein [Acidimicrobiales bacterium]MCB9372084.1 transcriptional regulator [Microthrixaceae bacterium]
MPAADPSHASGGAHPSAPGTLVLHGLRLKAFPETDALAIAAGLPVATVAPLLDELAAAGHVRRVEGRVRGWTLTAEGRREGERRLAEELDASGARDAVRADYDAFVALNPELLSLCTDWQVRGEEVNDHTDAGYDRAVVDRLVDLHVRARPLLADLRAHLARFASYPARLRAALERVTEGEREWFTKPTIDSYHTVWFELHEDLLATLGLERAKESET